MCFMNSETLEDSDLCYKTINGLSVLILFLNYFCTIRGWRIIFLLLASFFSDAEEIPNFMLY
jgi:hypothetical protein